MAEKNEKLLAVTETYAAIGQVALNWSCTEDLVEDYLCQLVGTTPDLGRVVTTYASFRSQIAAIRILVRDRLEESGRPTDTIKAVIREYDALDKKLNSLRTQRNQCVHTKWEITESKTNGVKLHGNVYYPRKSIQPRIIAGSKNAFLKTASDIAQANLDLLNFFLLQVGLLPSPDTSTPQHRMGTRTLGHIPKEYPLRPKP